MCSVRAGSPLSCARERRKAKRSGGKESGEEVPRKSLSRLADSPLDFELAARSCALVLHLEPAPTLAVCYGPFKINALQFQKIGNDVCQLFIVPKSFSQLGKMENKVRKKNKRKKKTLHVCIPTFVHDLIKDKFLIAYFQKLARNVRSGTERIV